MTRTKWTKKKTNEAVLIEIGEERSLIDSIMRRKVKLTGHLLRHNAFLTNILEGKVEGKRSRGRPRKSYFEDISKIMGCSNYSHLKRKASVRENWLHRQGISAFRI